MDIFELLTFLLPPYCIGLVFGFIYLVLFVELDSFQSYIPKASHFSLLLLLAFLYLFLYSLLMTSTLASPHHSSYETNWIFNMLMASLCFFSALYLFGFIRFSKVTFKEISKFRITSIFKALSLLFF